MNTSRLRLLFAAGLTLLVCGCVSGPRREELDLSRAKGIYDAGNYLSAAAEFDRIIASRPGSDAESGAYLGLGASYEAMHNYGEALTTYRLAVQLHPKNERLLLRLAALYYKLELYPESLAVYQTALRLNGDSVTGNLGIARTYMKTGYLRLAAQHYRTAIQNSGGDYKMRYAYADCLFKQRELLAAETEALNALSLNGSDPEIWFLLARIQFEHGSYEGALRSMETASSLSGGSAKTDAYRIMWLSRLGRMDQAVQLADTITERYPDDPLAAWAAGFVYLKAGNSSKAKTLLSDLASSETPTFISKSAARLMQSAGLASK